MRTRDLEYELPEALIAQRPAEPRDAAQLWVQSVGADTYQTATVADLASFLDPRDLLVFNNTKVLPARIWAQRASGARIELLFLEPAPSLSSATGGAAQGGAWLAMVRPAKKPREGEVLTVAHGLQVHMLGRELDESGQPTAQWRVRLQDPTELSRPTEELLQTAGEMPLPPYIQRDTGPEPEDARRYQTLFARKAGAVAAPTAGLHFTSEVLSALADKGIESVEVTLHVGLGTFLPIQAERIEDHRMHSERFEVSQAVVAAVEACRGRGGRVIAVGTTSARALEAAAADGVLRAGSGRTDLYIAPGYSYRVVDGLFTNFHLPGSTLLLLVGALFGLPETMTLYRRAIAARWRFYSYGDAMLLLPKSPKGSPGDSGDHAGGDSGG